MRGGPKPSGPPPLDSRVGIDVPFVPSCGRRTRSAAAGPHASVPPARRCSGAARGCPGSPSVRELRQKTEAAELIAGLPEPRGRVDRTSRLERPAAEGLPGSAPKEPGVLPESGTDHPGRSPPRGRPGRGAQQPLALRLRRVGPFGPAPGRSGSYFGTLVDPVGPLDVARAAGWPGQRPGTRNRAAPPVVDETGHLAVTPNGARPSFRLVHARHGAPRRCRPSTGGPRSGGRSRLTG